MHGPQRRLLRAALVAATALLGACSRPNPLPAPTEILDPRVQPVAYQLNVLSLAPDGHVYGARGAQLYRIVDNGNAIEPVHRFKDQINAIHFHGRKSVFIATDADHWDPGLPCHIYRSSDGGHMFDLVKTIAKGSALWWSFASDRAGNLYVGEYGPQARGMSKTVWKSTDDGTTWRAVFHAANHAKVHIHRVAVDPYSQDVWVTVGDGKRNRGAWLSHDAGTTWSRTLDTQATAIVFTRQAIYFGEDHRKTGRITRLDRASGELEEVLSAADHGPYGGSIYDMALGRGGEIYAPMMKYPKQAHIASLWAGHDRNWKPLLRLASAPGQATGFETIAGPDRNGWIYVRGFKIRDAH